MTWSNTDSMFGVAAVQVTERSPSRRARQSLREAICYLLTSPMTYDQLHAELRDEWSPRVSREKLDLALTALTRAREIQLVSGRYELRSR